MKIFLRRRHLSRCPIKGDFDGTCRVNLVDFSILAYWYGQPTAPAMYRFDGAPVVDLGISVFLPIIGPDKKYYL